MDQEGDKAITYNDNVIDAFSKNREIAIKKYQEYVNSGVNEKSPINNSVGSSILDDGVFKEKVHEYLKGIQNKTEIPEIKTFEIKYKMEDIIKIMAMYYGIKEDELLKRKNATQQMGKSAIYLYKILSRMNNA